MTKAVRDDRREPEEPQDNEADDASEPTPTTNASDHPSGHEAYGVHARHDDPPDEEFSLRHEAPSLAA